MPGEPVPDAEVGQRLIRERDFHNERFGAVEARKEDAFYFAVEKGASDYWKRVKAAAQGRSVLEYGCASGGNSLQLAPLARNVVGIDISDVAISKAKEGASRAALGNVAFQVDNAERMSLESGQFDLVFGSGILHHLDLQTALPEIKRVMRRGGRAIFWEPLGHNAAINLYRARTPHARTADEHPLLRRDFDLVRRHFASCDLSFYGLSTLGCIPLRGSAAGRVIRSLGERIDDLVLRIPGLRWQAWYVVMDLRA